MIKKILFGLSVLFLLVGCSKKVEEEPVNNVIEDMSVLRNGDYSPCMNMLGYRLDENKTKEENIQGINTYVRRVVLNDVEEVIYIDFDFDDAFSETGTKFCASANEGGCELLYTFIKLSGDYKK